MSDKTLAQHFKAWEADVFGFGYGTGEMHTLCELQKFFAVCETNEHEGYTYDYRKMEDAMTPANFWLMLNILCHADIIEYGTSPRFGWLTDEGIALLKFVMTHNINELYEIVMGDSDLGDYCIEGDNPFRGKHAR
jgi:hypothetical protein